MTAMTLLEFVDKHNDGLGGLIAAVLVLIAFIAFLKYDTK